ncbi:hypothetical protein DH2020_024295 [Rehmannia glutinosa]|uniref:ribonuclease Z n=1 Tax=Rehmannia glutinosa TaxID=99300 RepID=A0ABR0W5R4_REHGL
MEELTGRSDLSAREINGKSSKSNDPVNTTSYVQILGNGIDTRDTSPSVLLFFDKHRYIFNAGEIDQIFLLRVCSETAGGLPGLLLTLSGIGHGPEDLNYLAAAMQHFINDKLMQHFDWPGRIHDSNEDAISTSQKIDDHYILINNDFVKISALVLQPSQSESDVSEKNPIHPDDVLGPSVPCPIVLLIDCPTLLHFQELLSAQSFSRYYSDTAENVPNSSKNVNCVIHLSPRHVTETDDYQIWMSRFGAAQHIMAGHGMKNIKDLATRIGEPILAENFLKFQLRPHRNLGLDRSCLPDLTSPREIIHELQLKKLKTIETSSEKTCVQANVVVTKRPRLHRSALPDCMEDVSRDDMEIVFLGTGSSQPSKYRNVSSIFLNHFSKGSLLLDCGEATLGQLKRRFGIEGADEVVRSLRCIWISHIHADHHTGLARILTQRRDLLKGIPHDPLIVIGPVQLKDYLDAYERLEHLDMQFLDCEHTKESHTIVESLKKVLVEAGLETLISIPVEHCFRRSHSSYTRGYIQDDLLGEAKAKKHSTFGKLWKLVTCVATFEDELLDAAEAKKHSTTK